MRFGNSLRLLGANFKNAYKILVYQLLATLVFCALCSAFIVPEIVEVVNNSVTRELWTNVKNIFRSTFTAELGDPKYYINAVFGKGGSLRHLLDLLLSMRWQLILASIACVLAYLIKRFADTVVYFTIGAILNDKMSTYAETPFFTAFVANLGKACTYALVYVPVVFLFDVLTIVVCCLMLRFLPLLLALFLSVTFTVFCQSIKFTFTNQWMPAMTADGKKLREAIRYGSAKEKWQGGKVFGIYVFMVYLLIMFNAMAAICTFGSALLITMPTSYFLLICVQYVNYYTVKGKKYFITYERIAQNLDHGDTEHFFEYIEEAEKQEAAKGEIKEEIKKNSEERSE